MELVRILTLVYVAVLVLALAASLLAIWVYLRRIGAALAEARDALAIAARESSPLESHIQPLRDLAGEMADELAAADSYLEEADEHLARIADRLGAGSLAG
jgi:hypothetical protein